MDLTLKARSRGMSTPLQQALANLTPVQARAVFDAIGQFVENSEEPVALIIESGDAPSHSEVETMLQVEAAQEVLDRCNAALAELA